jgi:hypothetical protein
MKLRTFDGPAVRCRKLFDVTLNLWIHNRLDPHK